MGRRAGYISLMIGGELFKLIENEKMANVLLLSALKDASLRRLFDVVDQIIDLNEDLEVRFIIYRSG